MLEMSSGPSVSLVELIWMSWNWCAATWVRNGNPSMSTLGFLGNPCCWISDAALFSAKARAAKSAATSRAISTISTMMITRTGWRRRLGWPYPYVLMAGSPCR